MTETRFDAADDPLGPLVADALQTEAERITVEDRWAEIALRLSSPVAPTTSVRPSRRRRGRAIAIAVCSFVVAIVVVVAATVSGWRLFDGVEPAREKIPTTVPRYNPNLPNLVVYRSNIHVSSEDYAAAGFFLSPELRRTDSADIGVAALSALFDTQPVHGDLQPYGPKATDIDPTHIQEWQSWQAIDIISVTHADGLIRVELNGFASHLTGSKAADVMVQAWVYTLQDTLGTRDPVLITLQGRPFLLYGEVDTSTPIKRDESVRIKHVTGFDTPVESDVVSSPLSILGYVDAAQDRPARLQMINLTTNEVVVDQHYTSNTTELALVQNLQLGRHQLTLDGIDSSGDPYHHQVVITVVR